MKKTLAVAALSSMLVLGLAYASQADDTTTGVVGAGATKITLDGNVRVRGMYDKWDATKDESGISDYDSRVQVGLKAQVSDSATGYIKLESGSGSNDVDVWGNGHAAGLFTGGSKNGTLTILEAWLNYQPGDFGIKAGHMPLALGNKVFFDHTTSGDDAIVAYGSFNGGATNVAALTIKFDEQRTNDGSDDLDGYVALITHKVSDTLNLGANWTYLRGGSKGGTTVTTTTTTPGYWTVADSPADPTDSDNWTWTDPETNTYSTTTYELFPGMSMSNIGLTADGKIGAIDYMADAEIQFGTFEDQNNWSDSIDQRGWAMKLGANYDLGGGKVGLLFGYGSGNDPKDDNNNNNNAFVPFLADTNYDTIIAGYRSAIPGNGMGFTHGSPTNNSGLSNLTIYQLNGSAKTVCPLTGKDLSLFASASYMQLSEDLNTYDDKYKNNVGTELDLIASWALTSGLSYKVEAAYLFVGDVYETAPSGDGHNPDNLMFLRHSLDLKF